MKENIKKLNVLEFNVKVLKMMNLWPEDNIANNWRSWHFIRYYIFMMSLCPSGLPITFDMIYQLTGNMEELVGITENLVALAAWAGMYYMSGCFMKNQHQMKNLVNYLKKFNKFGKKIIAAWSGVGIYYTTIMSWLGIFVPQ